MMGPRHWMGQKNQPCERLLFMQSAFLQIGNGVLIKSGLQASPPIGKTLGLSEKVLPQQECGIGIQKGIRL